MSRPITWSGQLSESAAAEVDSDPISLGGVAGFSAIISVTGIANGNLQLMASNGGAAVSLGTLSVGVAAGGLQSFTFSLQSQFYETAWIRWTPTGPASNGEISGDWSLSASAPPPSPPTPSPSSGSTVQGPTAATQSYLTGIMLGLFPPSWVPDAAKGTP